MDASQTLPLVKQLIGEGNIEQALEQLVVLLDSDPKYSELAQAARVNQGELYQVKAQILKSTIAPEDARLTTNKVADNVLQIVARLEAGKLTLGETEAKPSRAQAWRYYIAGGIVTLAFAVIIWQIVQKNREGCPQFSPDTKYRVMILPFKQTGDKNNFEPEFEIADGLNTLISKTPRLVADADVNQGYDIDKNYPSFSEATEIARNCGVQMIVWGKINKNSDTDYKLDVFYKLLDGGNVLATGDTTLSNLLKINDEGRQLSMEAVVVTKLLYIKLANQAQVPITTGLFADMKAPAETAMHTAADTSWMFTMLALAENFQNNKQDDKAIDTYNKVLEIFPENQEARQKRGALLYKQGEYAAATLDLNLAAPDVAKAGTDLLKIRSDAAIKSSNPAQAMEDLNQLRQSSKSEEPWLKEKFEEVRDTVTALNKRLDKIERKAKIKPGDAKAQLDAGKVNANLGHTDQAINFADKVLKTNPQNIAAHELKIDALLAKGDSAGVEKAIITAEKSGVNTKSIERWRPIIDRLKLPERKQ